MDFSRERILENFTHDNTTGKIYRKRNGQIVDSRDREGYVVVAHHLNGKNDRMRAARLVWTLYHGDIPKGMVVDHINRVRDDNRLENLRLATTKQNARNKHSCSVDYTSKYRGVKKDLHGRWIAEINNDGKLTRLGKFDSEIAAAACYNEAALKAYGEFAYLNNVQKIDYEKHRTSLNRDALAEKRRNLPNGLQVHGNRLVVFEDGVRIGTFKTEDKEDAVLFCQHFKTTGVKLDLKSNLVTYNEHGLPYGVSPCSTGYRASFMKDRVKRVHVGTFKTVKDAQEALYLEQLEVFGYIKRGAMQHG